MGARQLLDVLGAQHAGGVAHDDGARLVAAGSSDPGRAAAFAAEAVEHGFADATAGDYAAVLADPRVTAVYISTVHTGHAALVLQALEAGKAVLCEKPLAVNHGTAMALVDGDRPDGVLLPVTLRVGTKSGQPPA